MLHDYRYTRSITRTAIIYLIRKETTNFHPQQPFMVSFFLFSFFLGTNSKNSFPFSFSFENARYLRLHEIGARPFKTLVDVIRG